MFILVNLLTICLFFNFHQINSYSNFSLEEPSLQEASVISHYAKSPSHHHPMNFLMSNLNGDTIILKSIPSSTLSLSSPSSSSFNPYERAHHGKVTEYSWMKHDDHDHDHEFDNHIKDNHHYKTLPSSFFIPVAQEVLFSEEGKYVPIDRDNRQIVRNYLKKNIYLSNCHNSIEKRPRILEIDLKKPFSYADSVLKWYVRAVRTDPNTKTTKIPSSVIQAKFLEFASQYIISE